MYIHEAVKAAVEEGRFITRPTAWWGKRIKTKPTNSPDCCMVFSCDNKTSPARGWQPQAEDLMADDWAVVD